MSNLGVVLSKLLYSNVSQPKVWGWSPQPPVAMGRGADLCWALGGIICNLTPILPYFQHWEGWTSTTIFYTFQVSKLSEDPQKKLSPKLKNHFPRIQVKTKKKKEKTVFARDGRLFPPNWTEDQRSVADQSQIIAGDAHVDHTQIIGGDISPIPPGFRHPWLWGSGGEAPSRRAIFGHFWKKKLF